MAKMAERNGGTTVNYVTMEADANTKAKASDIAKAYGVAARSHRPWLAIAVCGSCNCLALSRARSRRDASLTLPTRVMRQRQTEEYLKTHGKLRPLSQIRAFHDRLFAGKALKGRGNKQL
jgi:hypothetical protein